MYSTSKSVQQKITPIITTEMNEKFTDSDLSVSTPPIEALLNAKEVAEILNCSKPQVFLMMRRGDFPVVRMGKLVRVKKSDIESYINQQTISPKVRSRFLGGSIDFGYQNEGMEQK